MSTVLFATDLSEAARLAERLIDSIAWPGGTTLRVVTVVPWFPDITASPVIAATPASLDKIETNALRRAELGVRKTAARLSNPRLRSEWAVLRGRAPDAIVADAVREHADLIVVGSRGLGAVEGALVGSVSEAVVDRAPCPVLIARTDSVFRSLIADDATKASELALEYVRHRPYLLGASSKVFGVIPAAEPWVEALGVQIDVHSAQVMADDERAAEATLRNAIEADAERIRAVGHPTHTGIGDGRPAAAIAEEAKAWSADLIVMGSHCRRGVTRLVLGSVGRSVMHHSRCSVLVVGRVGERTAEELKISVGSAFPVAGPKNAEIRGRDVGTGLPRNVSISGDELRKAMEPPLVRMIAAVRATLDRCPPELAGDLVSHGIVLTGGGALLRGLDARLQHELGVPVLVAERPLDSVVLGTATVVEHFDQLHKVVVDGHRR